MDTVTEVIDGVPHDRPERTIKRDELRLFEAPGPAIMRFLNADVPPLAAYSLPARYGPTAFGPPRGIFEGPHLRVEWQTLSGRQPFYHRNADVDEIGFQICGERTLMTECGTVELRAGQFALIPAAVAHDNYCREDIHLLFYVLGPARACVPPVAAGKHLIPPFDGWEPRPTVEVSTNNLAAMSSDVAYSMVDEALLLDAAAYLEEKIAVLEPTDTSGKTEWIYKAPDVWIGHTSMGRTRERAYRRHLCAEEIQYQVSGSRTLITQRGVLTLQPGEFTSIPLGCAFAQITGGPSKHVSVLTRHKTPAVRTHDRLADQDVRAFLRSLRGAQQEVG